MEAAGDSALTQAALMIKLRGDEAFFTDTIARLKAAPADGNAARRLPGLEADLEEAAIRSAWHSRARRG